MTDSYYRKQQILSKKAELDNKLKIRNLYKDNCSDIQSKITLLTNYKVSIERSKLKADKHKANLTQFKNIKQLEGLKFLNETIQTCCQLVTGENEYKLLLKEQQAIILRQDPITGLETTLEGREGNGLRTLISMLMQLQMVAINNSCIPLIILDEAVALLSEKNKLKLNELLVKFKDDFIIIGIEQYRKTYKEIATKVYSLEKVDGSTEVSEGEEK